MVARVTDAFCRPVVIGDGEVTRVSQLATSGTHIVLVSVEFHDTKDQ